MLGRCMQQQEFVGHLEHDLRVKLPLHMDRQSLSCVLINDSQHPEDLAIMSAIHDEVIGPDMLWSIGSKTDTGTVIEPQTSR